MRRVRVQNLRPEDVVQLQDGDEVVDRVEELHDGYVAIDWIGWTRTVRYQRDQEFKVISLPRIDLVNGGGTDEHGGRGER